MKRALTGAIAGVAILGGTFGAAAGSVLSVDQHIATVVCHWTPAHGGWYVDIVVDDDGADQLAANGVFDLARVRPHRRIERDLERRT